MIYPVARSVQCEELRHKEGILPAGLLQGSKAERDMVKRFAPDKG